jgi:hypothetical protein
MEKDIVDLSSPMRNLGEALQGFADLNLVIDLQGTVLDCKLGYFLPYGVPEVVPGQKIQNIFSPLLAEKIEQALSVTQQTGLVQAFEYRLLLAGRERWFDARLAPLTESRFIFTARDNTKCKETENRMKQQMHQLSVLRSIDLAIASGLDLNLLLSMLLDQLNELMQIDAVAILLLNPNTHVLEFTAGKGFRSTSLQYTHLKLG